MLQLVMRLNLPSLLLVTSKCFLRREGQSGATYLLGIGGTKETEQDLRLKLQVTAVSPELVSPWS